MAKRPVRSPGSLRRLLIAAVVLVCAAALARYAADFIRAQRTDAALRESYLASPEPTEAPARVKDYIPVTPAPEGYALPKEGLEGTVAPATRIPSVTAVPAGERLEEGAVPDAPLGARFVSLRRQNADIVGWLRADGVVDTAVVQRDNVFYLDHDALGNENVSGAVFLEETVDLRRDPYTLILYGHNMKTGARFGALHLYEKPAFLRAHPFISLDTLYGEGTYVIAAVSTISLEEGSLARVDLSRLCSATVAWREKELKKIMALSIYNGAVDAEAGDRLLLLVTCDGDRQSRRVVLARRLRPGETEDLLSARAALYTLR